MTAQKRIMLIDDDKDHLFLTKLIFERCGYIVKIINECNQLEFLIEEVEQFHPHLIFIDHHMPGFCGLDATQLLKADPNFRNIPVVYLTSENNIAELAQEAEADGYLEKPFMVVDMLKLASKFLKK